MIMLGIAGNVELVKALSASGKSRAEVLDEADALVSAWKRINTAWVPVAGLPVASFELQIADCEEALQEYLDAKTNWRGELGKWNSITAGINRDCIGWYSDATHVFPEGSAEGDMIRSSIPTTTELTPLPEQAELTLNDPPSPDGYSITMTAEHATKFDVYQKGPTDTDYIKVGVDVLPGTFVQTGLAAGEYLIKAQPRNSRGAGPDSEVVGLTIG